MRFFFMIGFTLAIIASPAAYPTWSRQHKESGLDDPKRTIPHGYYRGHYSLEMDLKALAERAVGHSLKKADIERYGVVKKEFDRLSSTFFETERDLCLSRMATIEEALKGLTSTQP